MLKERLEEGELHVVLLLVHEAVEEAQQNLLALHVHEQLDDVAGDGFYVGQPIPLYSKSDLSSSFSGFSDFSGSSFFRSSSWSSMLAK